MHALATFLALTWKRRFWNNYHDLLMRMKLHGAMTGQQIGHFQGSSGIPISFNCVIYGELSICGMLNINLINIVSQTQVEGE